MEENCCICGGVFEDENSFSVLAQNCDTINQVNSLLGAESGRKVRRKSRLDLIRPKKLVPHQMMRCLRTL